MYVETKNRKIKLRLQVLTAARRRTVFLGVATCSPAEVYRRLRDACCLHCQGDEITLMMEAAASASECHNLILQTWRESCPIDFFSYKSTQSQLEHTEVGLINECSVRLYYKNSASGLLCKDHELKIKPISMNRVPLGVCVSYFVC